MMYRGSLTTIASWPPDAHTVYYVAEGSHTPPELWSVDLTTGHRQQMTHVNHAFDSLRLATSFPIAWRDASGAMRRGMVTVPPGYVTGTRLPTIVCIYGNGDPTKLLNAFLVRGTDCQDNTQMLATRGYALFAPQAPQRMGSPMADLATTVLPGIDRLIELGIADSSRIGVMGYSYGMYSALALMVQSSQFKAAVVGGGTSDLVTVGYADLGARLGAGWVERGQGKMGGTPWEFRDRYIENSPFWYLDRIDAPILIVRGAADSNHARAAEDQTFAALRRLGKNAEYVVYPGEAHGFKGVDTRIDFWRRTVGWFDRYLRQPESAQ